MFCLFRALWRGLTEMSRGNLSLVRGITFPQPRQIIREGLIFGLRLRPRTGLLSLGTGRRRNRLTSRTEMGFSWRGNARQSPPAREIIRAASVLLEFFLVAVPLDVARNVKLTVLFGTLD